MHFTTDKIANRVAGGFSPPAPTPPGSVTLKAIETSRSVSELVNEAVREALSEDAEDLAAFDERADVPLLSYYEMVKRLKKDGRI